MNPPLDRGSAHVQGYIFFKFAAPGGGIIQFVLFGNLGNKISTLAKFSFFPILFTIFENIVA
jgi:hypothetical protein